MTSHSFLIGPWTMLRIIPQELEPKCPLPYSKPFSHLGLRTKNGSYLHSLRFKGFHNIASLYLCNLISFWVALWPSYAPRLITPVPFSAKPFQVVYSLIQSPLTSHGASSVNMLWPHQAPFAGILMQALFTAQVWHSHDPQFCRKLPCLCVTSENPALWGYCKPTSQLNGLDFYHLIGYHLTFITWPAMLRRKIRCVYNAKTNTIKNVLKIKGNSCITL